MAVAAAAAPVAAAPRAPAAPQPPSSGAPAQRVAAAPGTMAQRPGPAASAAPRPVPTVVQGLTTLDKALAIAAAVASVAGMSAVLYLAFFLKDTTGS